MSRALVASLLVALSSPLTAHASEPEAGKLTVVHRYRKGFLLGIVTGFALGNGSGYPNDAQKIGNPDYYSRSGTLPGNSFQIFVGGALTDYLNFGVLFGGASFKSDAWEARASGIGFRVETFPAVLLLPGQRALAHLGLSADLGVGTTRIQARGNYPTAEGFQSFLGASAFYEFDLFRLLGGHVALAPELSYKVAYAESASVSYGTLAARLTFYGGP